MKPKHATRKVLLSIVVIVGLAGVAGATAWQASITNANKATSTDAKSEGFEVVPDSKRTSVPIRVFEIGTRRFDDGELEFTGTVRARYEINMAFRVSGKIIARRIEVGQRVEPGQVLFELDPIDFELQRKTAAANLDVAKAAVLRADAEESRQAQLVRSNATSKAEYEQALSSRDIARGQLDSATKQLELAVNQLEYCRLSTDVSGVVTSISAEAGNVVAAGSAVCVIAKDDELEAVVDIPENQLPKDEHRGTPVLPSAIDSTQASDAKHSASSIHVRFWSLPGTELTAKLRELSPTADPLTRTYRARFTLSHPDPQVKLGMTATVCWKVGTANEECSIPASAIFKRDGKPAVWLVDVTQGRLSLQPITIARFSNDSVVVESGLQRGQVIASAGVYKLDESMRVRVWEFQK